VWHTYLLSWLSINFLSVIYVLLYRYCTIHIGQSIGLFSFGKEGSHALVKMSDIVQSFIVVQVHSRCSAVPATLVAS